MLSIYHSLIPTIIPPEVCDIILIFAGIQTPSCKAFAPYNEYIHTFNGYKEGDNTIWTIRVQIKQPIPVRIRPYGATYNDMQYSIIIAYHSSIVNYLNGKNEVITIFELTKRKRSSNYIKYLLQCELDYFTNTIYQK